LDLSKNTAVVLVFIKDLKFLLRNLVKVGQKHSGRIKRALIRFKERTYDFMFDHLVLKNLPFELFLEKYI